ncbi:alpha/beta fold hydrolase [Streptomyces sp. NPDC091272]|uniref:alpha/beta fold hydrolase n=1 Tax=Streptomyces sp. NPDC091272 TaxID=3365981 RepID=UPI00381B9E2E
MTAFVLVSGMFTDAHVWERTAALLTAAGDEVHTVCLTGLGDSGGGTGAQATAAPDVDLETHIADVVAVIDAVVAAGADAGAGAEGSAGRRGGSSGPDIVLVGHDYGIHPAVGAADRRAGHVTRIVHLDSGLPQDGVPVLAALPDGSLRAQLAERAEVLGVGGELAAPAGSAEWQRWGSTEGVSDAALDRLTALAAPQPLATLLQPLKLTGAAAGVPSTGVLCTRNGASIEMVQTVLNLGDPAMRALADPAVSFFELPTGHWPMLSCPAELAEVLRQAAAGGGHRLELPDESATPPHLQPFLLDLPDIPRERAGNVDRYVPEADRYVPEADRYVPEVDLYVPEAAGARGPLPAVVVVHGGPVPAGARPTPREWPTLTGYARYAAAEGVIGATVDHRLHDVGDFPRAAADIAAAVERVRADPRVDADRIALWFFSGSGPLTADWLASPPPWLRCLAATYPIMAPLPNWGLRGSRFRPARAVAGAGGLPVVLTRAGLETPVIAGTVEEFLTAAADCGANVEVVDVPEGHHGFESLDRTDASREAVHRAVHAVLGHLRA